MWRDSPESERITKYPDCCLFFFFCPIKGYTEAPSAVGLLPFPLATSTSLGSHGVGAGCLQTSIPGWFLPSPGAAQWGGIHVRRMYSFCFQRRYNVIQIWFCRRAETITKPSMAKSTLQSGHMQSLCLSYFNACIGDILVKRPWLACSYPHFLVPGTPWMRWCDISIRRWLVTGSSPVWSCLCRFTCRDECVYRAP